MDFIVNPIIAKIIKNDSVGIWLVKNTYVQDKLRIICAPKKANARSLPFCDSPRTKYIISSIYSIGQTIPNT